MSVRWDKKGPTSVRTHSSPSGSVRLAAWTQIRSGKPRVSTNSVRLRPLTFFSPVEAAHPADFGRLDGLAIDNGGRWLCRAALAFPDPFPQGVGEGLEGAIIGPSVEVVAHAGEGRIILGQHAPLTARAQQIQQGIDDLPPLMFRGPSHRGARWQQGLQDGPFFIGDITRVALFGLQFTHAWS